MTLLLRFIGSTKMSQKGRFDQRGWKFRLNYRQIREKDEEMRRHAARLSSPHGYIRDMTLLLRGVDDRQSFEGNRKGWFDQTGWKFRLNYRQIGRKAEEMCFAIRPRCLLRMGAFAI